MRARHAVDQHLAHRAVRERLVRQVGIGRPWLTRRRGRSGPTRRWCRATRDMSVKVTEPSVGRCRWNQ